MGWISINIIGDRFVKDAWIELEAETAALYLNSNISLAGMNLLKEKKDLLTRVNIKHRMNLLKEKKDLLRQGWISNTAVPRIQIRYTTKNMESEGSVASKLKKS